MSNIEILRDTVTKSLSDSNINVPAKVVSNGNSVEVSDEDIFIWIRTLPRDGKLDVDISAISLDETLQHKGVFTNLFNSLKSLDIIQHLKIGSVCTDEMRSWCEKNNLEKRDDDYIWR